MAWYQFPYVVHIVEDIRQRQPMRIVFLEWRHKYVNEGCWDLGHQAGIEACSYIQASEDLQRGPDLNRGLA